MTTALLLLSLVGGGKIEWSKLTLDEALAQARKTGTPVMAYFTADW